jgi:nucleoside-diphosphate-sugar epimerase
LIDVKQMLPNINKIKAEFDYTPRFSLSQSLDQCIKYYN